MAKSPSSANGAPPIPPPGLLSTAKQRSAQVDIDIREGRRAFDAEDYTTAVNHLIRAVQIDPRSDVAYYWLGRSYLAAQIGQTAIVQFNTALAINPRNEFYYFARAKAEVTMGLYPAALVDFQKTQELHKGALDALFHTGRGDAYFYNGQSDLARQDYDQALTLDKTVASAYLHRAVIRARLGDHPSAMADFDAALQAVSKTSHLNFDIHYFRGLAEQLHGDRTAALADYEATRAFDDARQKEAQCLAARLGGQGPASGSCRGVDPKKELQKPPA
ncbi:MAG: tetratricopeptide repeat protein [Caulobacteraceae bacterium]|nr:tetratricopeptide repeat protein [Caulobacteraceae bacterium]